MIQLKNVVIISVGGIKQDSLQNLAAEYDRRLSPYAAVKRVVLPEKGDTEAQGITITKALANLGGSVYTVALDSHGEQLTSEAFAELIKNELAVRAKLCFVIGGSDGLSPSVKIAADKTLSFSKMTLPRSLANALLSEQIYRGFMINAGRKYHK